MNEDTKTDESANWWSENYQKIILDTDTLDHANTLRLAFERCFHDGWQSGFERGLSIAAQTINLIQEKMYENVLPKHFGRV